MVKRLIVAGCLLVMGASWLVTPAYAYLDPGTGSMLLQALIGGVAAAGALASIYFAKLKTFIAGIRGRGKGGPSAPEDDVR